MSPDPPNGERGANADSSPEEEPVEHRVSASVTVNYEGLQAVESSASGTVETVADIDIESAEGRREGESKRTHRLSDAAFARIVQSIVPLLEMAESERAEEE